MSEETETVKIGEAVEVEAEPSGSRTTLDDVIDVTKVWDAELRACQSLIRSLNRNTPSNELAEKKRFFKRVRAPGTRWSAWLTAQHRAQLKLPLKDAHPRDVTPAEAEAMLRNYKPRFEYPDLGYDPLEVRLFE